MKGNLKPWQGGQLALIGVDGTQLQVHGSATMELTLGQGLIVVSPLTTPAILGADFLREH